MRVLGGRLKGRRLSTVAGQDVRPTAAGLRQVLFDVLGPELPAGLFVDAYCGSGGVGIEALSRGAEACLFVDRSSRSLAVVHRNLRACDLTDGVRVVRGDAPEVLERHAPDRPVGVLFADPPYASDELQRLDRALHRAGWRPELLVLEHGARHDPGEQVGGMCRIRSYGRGDSRLSFYGVTA